MKLILLILCCLLLALLSRGQDSLLQEKYFKVEDAKVNYLLEYRFSKADAGSGHYHAPAMITVTAYWGNKQIELGTVLGFYASTFCDPLEKSKDDAQRWITAAQAEYEKQRR